MADSDLPMQWMEQTFTSKAVTETLLNPERESGNITPNDLTELPAFCQGTIVTTVTHQFVGGLAALPLVFAFRRMRWSNTRMYLFVSASTLAGFLAGQTLCLAAHFKFVRSIENPIGFSQAMTNIQSTLGGKVPQSPIIVRQGEKVAVGHDMLPIDGNYPNLFVFHIQYSASSDAHPQPTPPPLVTPPSSKWDQIRALNSRTAGHSSWDTLRQNHERARMSTKNSEEPTDRAMEQAQFDDMLEKERNR
ncbi:hypothetical protein BD779DRAFT_1484933 [Infundibulicybe gibba]|nr:hypothetical protein BD779DRAFT_1484933 [Infundibulicybe gibba]